MEERLQKILARAGYGSRRANEELITAGRVRVNGQVAVLGSKADASKDSITVDGAPVGKVMPELVYIALHKPRGVLSDEDPNDPNPRQTVRDLIPVPGHLFAVGRLDFDSEGLILMTNDGELANRLTHPRYEHEKEYRVLIGTRPDEEQMSAWRRGIVLEDGTRTMPAEVNIDSLAGKGTWLRVILREGKKRQIREVGKRIGLPVVRIVRVRIGSLELGGLKPREWRHLSSEEIRSLKKLQNREQQPRRKVQRKPGPSPKPAHPDGGQPVRSRRDVTSPSGQPADKPYRPASTGRKPGAVKPGSRPGGNKSGKSRATGAPGVVKRGGRPAGPK